MKMDLDSNFRVGFFRPNFCRMSGGMDGFVAKNWEGVSSEVFYGLAVRRGRYSKCRQAENAMVNVTPKWPLDTDKRCVMRHP